MKGLLGKAKIPITIFSVILLAIFVINFVLPSIAASGSALVWTTDAEGVDKTDFAPEEIVYIYGIEFSPITNVVLTITTPEGNPFTNSVMTDENGLFSYQYDLDGMIGTYTINVDDGNGNTAQTLFTDNPDFKTYENSGYTTERYIFAQSSTVYTKSTNLENNHGYKFEWRDTSDSVVRTSSCFYGSTSYTDSYTLSGSATSGTWKIKLIDYGHNDNTCSSPSTSTQIRYNVYIGTLLTPTDDSYVRWSGTGTQYQNNNYDNDNVHVKWKSDGSLDRRRSYLKFDLSSIPNNAIITSAKFHLYRYEGEADPSGESIGAYFVSDDTWTESGITWNNAPAMGSQMSSIAVGPDDGGYIWDVTSQVSSEITGDDMLSTGLKFTDESTTKHQDFCDRELTGSDCDDIQNPYLEITYTVPPQQICGNGIVEGSEQCDSGANNPNDCCTSNCQFESNTYMCGAATGDCDVAEYCSGQSATCPADGVQPNTYVCRQSAGQCDVEEKCDGQTKNCPADAKATYSTPCSNGLYCDGPDHCDGTGSCVNLGPSINCDDQSDCTIDSCDEGQDTCINTFVDNDGPDTSNVVVDPYYNNGIFNLTATTQDQCSVIKTAEYFVGFVNGGVGSCDPDAPVKGTIYPADDGSFNLDKLLENLLKKNIVFRSDGVNWACVKAQDNANNWGNCECVNFETDVLPPDCPYDIYLDNVLYPDEYLICGNNAWLNATVCDQESKMQGGEYFLDITIPPVPVPWSGFWMNTLYNFTRQDSWKCSVIGALVDTSNLEDGTHYIKLRGKDTAENWGKISECLGVSFVRDTTAPSTTKDVDETKIRCGITSDDEKGNSIEQCWYIQQGTHIHLTASDPNPQQTGEFSGLDKIMCQFRWKLNWEDDWSAWSAPAECPNPIVFNEDSYHEIKYWAVDNCGNAEAPHYEIDIVDTQAPLVTKSVGTPQHVCGERENCDYYITGQTPITLDCVDQGPHPVDNVKIYYRYYLDGQTELPLFTEDSDHVVFTIPQDSRHIVEYYCVDALGNSDGTMQTPYHEVDIVDNKPPIVSKDVGTPKVESTGMTQYQVPDKFDVNDTAWFITQNTEITLSCQDDEPHPSDHVKIYYKYYVDGVLHTDWTEYTGTPIKYNEDTYHELYYFCNDTLGNKGDVHYELDIVDTQAPETIKTVGDPKYGGTGEVDWWITQQTTITLDCTDQGPHPVDDVTLYYRIYNDSILIQDWTLYTGTFHFTEDSEHRLEWYCVDALGNSEGSAENPIVEIDQVDTAPPEIVKWVDDSTVQQGDTVRICANVTDKKLTGDPGVGVAWVKAKLILGEDPIYVDLTNVEGDTYCGDWVVPQIKECYRCFGLHCEYRCVWELWVKSEDLLGNFNKTDGIQIIVDDADPKIQAVLWPSKDKYYRDGKKFEVKALAIDFGGDENILNSDNCKASGVKECRFYAIKYDFESVDQSEIKNLWDYLKWLEETTGEPIKTVYLGSVPWVDGYCKGSLQFPVDSGLNHEDILFLAYEIEDNSGNMKSGLAEDWDGDKVTMKMDQVGPSVVITEGGNLPGPFTTGDLVQVFATLEDIDSGPADCWADIYKCIGEEGCEESVDTGYNLNGYVYDFTCEISDGLPAGLASGDYEIRVVTTDNELNTGTAWDYLIVDNTPPEIELLQPEPEGTYDEEIPIEIGITDEISPIEDSTVQYRIFEPSAWYSGLLCLFGYCPYDSTWQTAIWNSTTGTYKDTFDASELVQGKTYFLAIRGCDVLYDSMLFTDNTVDLYHCVMR